MKIISWNASGISNENSLAYAYVFWFYHTHHPMFIFLSETKSLVSLAQSKFNFLNLNFVVGVDALGSKGGLIVLGFTNHRVTIMHACQNFILCNVCEPNGTQWNVCFFYGAPVVNDRAEVLGSFTSISAIFNILHDYWRF